MKKKEMLLLACLLSSCWQQPQLLSPLGGATAGHWQKPLLSAIYGVQV